MNFKKQPYKQLLLPIYQPKVLPINLSRTLDICMLDNFSFTVDNYNNKFKPRFRKLAHYGRFQFYYFYWQLNGMLYERFQLLLLLQSGFNQLLSESLIEKFYCSYLRQLAREFQFCLLFADRRLWQIFFSKRIGHWSFSRMV